MQGLIATLKADRELNHQNARRLFLGFAFLFLGLLLVAAEAAAAAIVERVRAGLRPPPEGSPFPTPELESVLQRSDQAEAAPRPARARFGRTLVVFALVGVPSGRDDPRNPEPRPLGRRRRR
jgi:hypothetical protein